MGTKRYFETTGGRKQKYAPIVPYDGDGIEYSSFANKAEFYIIILRFSIPVY